jgi:hypothetical protein
MKKKKQNKTKQLNKRLLKISQKIKKNQKHATLMQQNIEQEGVSPLVVGIVSNANAFSMPSEC